MYFVRLLLGVVLTLGLPIGVAKVFVVVLVAPVGVIVGAGVEIGVSCTFSSVLVLVVAADDTDDIKDDDAMAVGSFKILINLFFMRN